MTFCEAAQQLAARVVPMGLLRPHEFWTSTPEEVGQALGLHGAMEASMSRADMELLVTKIGEDGERPDGR